MAQEEKPESMDNKIDALAAMAGGRDISHEGFNAPEEIPDPDQTGKSDAAAALAAQTGPADPDAAAAALIAQTPAPEPAAPAPVIAPVAATSASRKSRVAALQKNRARVHAEQFKRMMVPILLVTGVLLIALGAIVAFMMRGAPVDAAPSVGILDDPNVKRIMVITAFPLGAILMVGAWMFRMDVKRGEAAAKREEDNGEN